MTIRAKPLILGAGLLAYASLIFCFFYPVIRPLGISPAWHSALLGPPAILFWGVGALPWFLGFALALAACAFGALLLRELWPLFVAVSVAIWLFGGLLSFAMGV